jgi:hypothetical protein
LTLFLPPYPKQKINYEESEEKEENKKCNLNKKEKHHQLFFYIIKRRRKLTSAQVYFVRHKLFDTNGNLFFKKIIIFISMCIFLCFIIFQWPNNIFFSSKTALRTFMTTFFRFYFKKKKINDKKKI